MHKDMAAAAAVCLLKVTQPQDMLRLSVPACLFVMIAAHQARQHIVAVVRSAHSYQRCLNGALVA